MNKKIIKSILAVTLLIVTCILSGCGNIQNQTQNNSIKEYKYYYDTDIPTLESVFNYENPFIKNDSWEIDKTYYASYSKTGVDGYNSEVNGDSDYAEYSKLLQEKGYKLINTKKDDGATNYTYSNDKNIINLRIRSNSFEITIKSNI